jgi:hypothetical protein
MTFLKKTISSLFILTYIMCMLKCSMIILHQRNIQQMSKVSKVVIINAIILIVKCVKKNNIMLTFLNILLISIFINIYIIDIDNITDMTNLYLFFN